MSDHCFLSDEERKLNQDFLDRGYVIVDVEDREILENIQQRAAQLAADHLNISLEGTAQVFLDNIHQYVSVEKLNGLRLAVIQGLNADPDIRRKYFLLARHTIECLVGNELAMQRRLNLSVQLPQDDSSLLPIHADVWDGDSPFEVVAWLPLVDCYKTKAMYLVEANADQKVHNNFDQYMHGNAEELYQAVEEDAPFINIDFGKIMIFSLAVMHGNRVNVENETRWSMNVRFKSLLAPYADKRLGEFFDPITLRAATRKGMHFNYYPGVDDD